MVRTNVCVNNNLCYRMPLFCFVERRQEKVNKEVVVRDFSYVCLAQVSSFAEMSFELVRSI